MDNAQLPPAPTAAENDVNKEQITNKEAFRALIEIDEKERTFQARQGYWMAYIWSVLLPPLGIYFFIKYLFFANGTRDDFKAGTVSLVLTVISLLLSIWLFGLFFKQATSAIPSPDSNILKELITPGNQKALKDLYQ